MSYWGKIFGGVTGAMMAGPWGAVVGAALGHAADRGSLPGVGAPFPTTPSGPNVAKVAAGVAAMLGRKEQTFAIGMVVLAAKLAKSDGPVVRAEIDAFKRHFRIAPEQAREVGRLFDQARDAPDGPDDYARQMGRAYAGDRQPLEDALAALVAIARADGPINDREEKCLRRVAAGFGLGARAFDQIRDGAARRAPEEPDAYVVLGLPRDATDMEVHTAWRQLMRENHPDSLASRGAPEAVIAKAAERVARINNAWDRIKRERGL